MLAELKQFNKNILNPMKMSVLSVGIYKFIFGITPCTILFYNLNFQMRLYN